jgi:hypothetical protein
MRKITIGVAMILTLTGAASSAATVESLTEQVHRSRVRVVKVDRATGKVLCADSGRWLVVARQDLDRVQPGDIVRLERGPNGAPPRVVVVRTAAQELSSPEN